MTSDLDIASIDLAAFALVRAAIAPVDCFFTSEAHRTIDAAIKAAGMSRPRSSSRH
jgi:hypothetical protein